MDPQNQNQEVKVCTKHKQPVILFDIQYQPLCIICVQEKTGNIQIDQVQQKQQEIKIKSEELFKEENEKLLQLQDSLLKYKQNIINEIDKIIKIIIDQMEKNNQFKEKFSQQLTTCNQLESLQQLNNDLYNQQYHTQIKQQMKKQLLDFQKQYLTLDYFDKIQESTEKVQKSEENQNEPVMSTRDYFILQLEQAQIEHVKLKYELIRESQKRLENSFAFAFNKDNTLLSISWHSNIYIYQFINGQIGQELQVLKQHKDYIYNLFFMKSSNCFVSASWDKSIVIWKLGNNNKWIVQQIIQEHSDKVKCVLKNKNEDLLVSGSDDQTIKFWKKKDELWIRQQTIQTNNQVWQMCLNEQEDKLIMSGDGSYLLILQNEFNQQWSITQKINVNECGSRLCFTVGNQFVFQPQTQLYIEVYDYDFRTKKFKKESQLQKQYSNSYDASFPCFFLKSQNILLVKFSNHLNIIKISEDKNYELIQTIEFQWQNNLHGTVSDDGQYLITWNERYSDDEQDPFPIQIRKLKLINL